MAETLLKHPMYLAMEATWRTSLDVHEGLGGFLDPARPYLVPHPREWLDHSIRVTPSADQPSTVRPNPSPRLPSPKLEMRRRLARYENIAETIVHQVSGALFFTPPARTFGATQSERILEWWQNTDGRGTAIDALIQDAWTASAVFGHSLFVVDRPAKEAATAADIGLPMVRRYTPIDLIDWLLNDKGEITAVKLLEAAPRADFSTAPTVNDYRVRVITDTEWYLEDRSGARIDGAEHGMGRLPVVFLYAKRRALTPVIGKSVMGDPQLYVDLYNLTSEVRELLRNQTFAILNVPIGTAADASVEREQQLVGSQVGTGGVMFSSQPAQYVSPDSANAGIYHEHIDRLARMIYRLAASPWEGDSRDAESAESRRLKRSEQQQVLSTYAREVQRAELELLELVYRAVHGAEAWEKAWGADQPSVVYATDFEPPDVQALSMAAAEAIGTELGPTATKEIKKRLARKILPDLDAARQQAVDAEIEGQVLKTAEEKRQEIMGVTMARFAGGTEREPERDEPGPTSDEGVAA